MSIAPILFVSVVVAVVFAASVYLEQKETAARDRRAQKARVLRRLGYAKISTEWGTFAPEEADERDLDEALTAARRSQTVVRRAG